MRTLEIRCAADVEPRLVHWIDDGPRCAFLQPREQGRHVTRFPDVQGIEGGRIKHIDSRIDVAAADRLFLESDDVDAFAVNDSEWVLPFV